MFSLITKRLRQPWHHKCLLVLLAVFSVGTALHAQAASTVDPVQDTLHQLRAATSNAKAAAASPTLRREDFLRQPPLSDVKLSPDGQHLVFLQRMPQQTDLMRQDLQKGKTTRVLADVRQLTVEWADAGQTLWLADHSGLARYDLTTQRAKRILKWDDTREQRWWGVDATAPQYALVREKIAVQNTWQYRVLRIDADGKSELLLAAAQPIRGMLLNRDGSLAYATVYEGPHYDTVVRRYRNNSDGAIDKGHNSHGTEILRCIGADQCSLLGHDETRNALWLLTHHGEERSALKRWQVNASGAGQWHTEHRDPMQLADVASVLWQPQSNDWLGIAYHPNRRHWYGRDDNHTKRLNTLQQQLPDASLTLTTNTTGKQWLVQAKHSQWELDRFYLYTPSSNTLHALFTDIQQHYQPFAPAQLSPAVPLHYRSRDGMLVHGYVYLPRGVDPATVPLIAHIHGGPFNRDRDYYSGIFQLLVNRGYAVFTPNFRASTGFGRQHLHATNGDFGNAGVLDDIISGMDFLLANGVGDRSKQAVAGHSFGGYASLLAVSHYPDRFRFAVATAAPVDFSWTMQEIVTNGGSGMPPDSPPGDIYLSHHGVRFDDPKLREKLRRESPLALLEKLKAPIYLWAGAKDDRVPVKSLSHYAGEAKRLRKSVTLLLDPDTGHNPEKAVNLEALVYLLESAGARHFGGALTTPSVQLDSFLHANLRLKAEVVVLN